MCVLCTRVCVLTLCLCFSFLTLLIEISIDLDPILCRKPEQHLQQIMRHDNKRSIGQFVGKDRNAKLFLWDQEHAGKHSIHSAGVSDEKSAMAVTEKPSQYVSRVMSGGEQLSLHGTQPD